MQTNRKTRFKIRQLFLTLMIFVILFTLIGCNSNETIQPVEEVGQPSAEDNKKNNEQNEENEIVESPTYEFIAPLTGLPVEHEMKNRIIGVMVNNHNQARPQSGVHQADMVYEILAEGMITRLVAIYQSQEPEVIGPVRSIRPYYIDLINGFDAYIVHAGSSQEALEILQRNPLPDLDEIENAGSAFWRASFRSPPHNVYTSTEKLLSVAKLKGYREEGYIPQLIFLKDEMEVKGDKANFVKITYDSSYQIAYEYDESTKLYNRFTNGKPHTDLETTEQLTAKNLLVIEAYHKIIDDVGRRKVDVYGPGKGYLFQNGVFKEITWERKDGIIRAFIDGKEQGLYPGQTWTIFVQRLDNVHIQ